MDEILSVEFDYFVECFFQKKIYYTLFDVICCLVKVSI